MGQRSQRWNAGLRVVAARFPTRRHLPRTCPEPAPRGGQGGRGGRGEERRRTRCRGISARSSGSQRSHRRPVSPRTRVGTLEDSNRAGIRRMAWGLREVRTRCGTLRGPLRLEGGQPAPRRRGAVRRAALRRVVGGREQGGFPYSPLPCLLGVLPRHRRTRGRGPRTATRVRVVLPCGICSGLLHPWSLIRPRFFRAAAPCSGSQTAV